MSVLLLFGAAASTFGRHHQPLAAATSSSRPTSSPSRLGPHLHALQFDKSFCPFPRLPFPLFPSVPFPSRPFPLCPVPSRPVPSRPVPSLPVPYPTPPPYTTLVLIYANAYRLCLCSPSLRHGPDARDSGLFSLHAANQVEDSFYSIL